MFDKKIEHKRVTNGNDKQILKDKFRETFAVMMEPAMKILLADIPGPSPTEWRLFLQDTLRWCSRLQIIDLSHNESISGVTLEPVAALSATLEFLDVSKCVGFAGTLDALKTLRRLRALYLSGCVDLGAAGTCMSSTRWQSRRVSNCMEGFTSWRPCRSSNTFNRSAWCRKWTGRPPTTEQRRCSKQSSGSLRSPRSSSSTVLT